MGAGFSRPRHKLAAALRSFAGSGGFTARRRAPVDDLDIEIRGYGRLKLPLVAAQAKELRTIARPARYGRGEETLLDRRVRDTWEIPRSRVKIDKRRWNATLLPMVESLSRELGLPAGSRLTAELHSVLLYEPGQFFAPHKDSEKADGMVASLVVVLPSNATGGDLVVEHRRERVTHRPSRTSLTFVAFYADTIHEIRPVKSGWRMALTYNLFLRADVSPSVDGAGSLVDEDRILEVAALLARHFAEPADPPSWLRHRSETLPADRLVYLLDHDYTERGLDWSWLKGDDVPRAAALRAAAERVDCETALVLADVHETWDCMEEHWGGRTRRWERGRPVRSTGDEGPSDLDGYELGDLIESEVSLIGPTDSGGERVLPAEEYELCATTPTVELPAYESDYQGYMGNYGNTMDRWYRRGAVVVWPHSRAFVVEARTDPVTAFEALIADYEQGTETDESLGMRVAELLPSWPDTVRQTRDERLVPATLQVSALVDNPTTAGGLLDPFDIHDFSPAMAPALVPLVGCHGEDWLADRLRSWSTSPNVWRLLADPAAPDSALDWLAALPETCSAVIDAATAPHLDSPLPSEDHRAIAHLVARRLVDTGWAMLDPAIDQVTRRGKPSERDAMLGLLGSIVARILRSTVIADHVDLRARLVEQVSNAQVLAPLGISLVRAAGDEMSDPEDLTASGVATVAQQCATWLRSFLDRRERAEGDWSLALPSAWHACDDCETLGTFLSDPSADMLEWPLAKPRRQHVHQVLDNAELPVRHETRRQGRPYTLVLTKTPDLWEREGAARRSAQLDLDAVVRVLDRVSG